MPRIDRDDRRLTLRLASAAALVGVLATGCDTSAPEERDQWRGPYHLETAFFVAPPAKSAAAAVPRVTVAAVRPLPRLAEVSESRPGRDLAVTAVPAPPSLALAIEAPALPTGGIVPPQVMPPGVAPPVVEREPEAPAQLAVVIPDSADHASGAGAVTEQAPADVAYLPQISDSARTAYVAQVDAAGIGQRMAVRAGDKVLGQVEFQVADGHVSVRIGQVLDLFQDKMDGAEFAQLRASSGAGEFVSLDRIHAAGIPLVYNAAYDELTLDTGRS